MFEKLENFLLYRTRCTGDSSVCVHETVHIFLQNTVYFAHGLQNSITIVLHLL